MAEDIPMKVEKIKELHKRMVNMEVSIIEQEMLKQVRTVKHGKFIVQIMDGCPFRMQLEISKFFEGGRDFDV